MTDLLWHGIERCEHNVLRVREIHVDNYAVGDIWVVKGASLDVAVDGGSGIVAPAPMIEGLSDQPVLCVALTCSYDHAGGWHSFAQRACHRNDAATLADPTDENAAVPRYLTPDRIYRLPHAGWSVTDYAMVPAEPTRLLDDGDTIDLGDRQLRVLHTPGRSPGGLSLWEPETGLLFSGEMLYDGDHGPAWPPADPAAYAASLRRLRALDVRVVHPGHYGSFGARRMHELIDEQLADLAERELIRSD